MKRSTFFKESILVTDTKKNRPEFRGGFLLAFGNAAYFLRRNIRHRKLSSPSMAGSGTKSPERGVPFVPLLNIWRASPLLSRRFQIAKSSTVNDCQPLAPVPFRPIAAYWSGFTLPSKPVFSPSFPVWMSISRPSQ